MYALGDRFRTNTGHAPRRTERRLWVALLPDAVGWTTASVVDSASDLRPLPDFHPRRHSDTQRRFFLENGHLIHDIECHFIGPLRSCRTMMLDLAWRLRKLTPGGFVRQFSLQPSAYGRRLMKDQTPTPTTVPKIQAVRENTPELDRCPILGVQSTLKLAVGVSDLADQDYGTMRKITPLPV